MGTPTDLTYLVSFPNASRHYVRIGIELDLVKDQTLIFKMPVWTPGSYKVREFSKNVDAMDAESNGKSSKVFRRDKNSWLVEGRKGKNSIAYDVYAFELGVRSSYVDLNKAFLHGVSVFMYVEGLENESVIIDIEPLKNWSGLHVALPSIGKSSNKFRAENYDLLVDSPFALGNFDTISYTSGNTVHDVVMIGNGNYDLTQVRDDFKSISDAELAIFKGSHPSDRYIHFIQNVDNGGGGLEHKNCQTSQVNRWAYQDKKKYTDFLGLVAHEYFHLWNVKRIRARELGPFNYDVENYTDLLWIAEGFTSYYDDLILYRTGFLSEEEYLAVLAKAFSKYENKEGKTVMTLAESSRLAWVKGYFPNENSDNVTISYYNKGLIIAWMLDMKVMEVTGGKQSLDDIMRSLYSFSQAHKEGFEYEQFLEICNDVAGVELRTFFNNFVFGLKPIPYAKILGQVGLNIENKTDSKAVYLGIKVKAETGKSIITFVQSKGSANEAGLSVHDELIAVDGWRVSGDAKEEISRLKLEVPVEVIYARDAAVSSTMITPKADLRKNFEISSQPKPLKSQKALKAFWLRSES